MPLNIEDYLDHVGHLAAQGHIAAAKILADEQDPHEPLLTHLGHAMIAATRNDAAELARQVDLAAAVSPDSPHVAHARVMLHLLRGALDLAEEEARRAVALDDSTRSWRGLANVLLARGQAADAERALRELLSRHDDPDARLLLARVKAQRGDHGGALTEQAHAFLAAPADPRPFQQAIGQYRDAAWPVGVLLLSRVTRGGEHPPEVQVMLDLIAMQMLAQIGENPVREMLAVDDDTVQGLVQASASLPPSVQLRVARVLIDHGRREVATVVGRLDHGAMGAADRAEVAFCEGLALAKQRRVDEALGAYGRAVDAFPSHWEAACNAVNLCLERRTPEALEQAGHIITKVPEAVRRQQPAMTFNEAVWLDTVGRTAEARRLVAWLREGPTGNLEPAVKAFEAKLLKSTPPS